MMSQQRGRKAGGPAMEPIRGRQSVVKASGDSMPPNVQNKQPNVRSTSKSTIPKSLRYDLENALVGLCDVWFEEIKPHLVSNNIKLHVHGGAGPASGDHQRLPPGAPGCSHLDPGAAPDLCQPVSASYAGCYSTQPIVSRARCRRPPASCLPSPQPVLSPSKLRASLLNPCQNCETKLPHSIPRRTPRRLKPQTQPKSQSQQSQHSRDWRTPRLCKTYSILTPRTIPARRTRTADPKTFRRSKRRPKKVDKSTQTPALRRPELLPLLQEYPWSQEQLREEILQQELLKQELLSQQLKALESSKVKIKSPSCLRCPATTNIQRVRQPAPPVVPLFQEDLINIIGDKHDKQLRLLFKSPTSDQHASTLNLVQGPLKAQENCKRVPWR